MYFCVKKAVTDALEKAAQMNITIRLIALKVCEFQATKFPGRFEKRNPKGSSEFLFKEDWIKNEVKVGNKYEESPEV